MKKRAASLSQATWDGYEDDVLFLNKLYNEGLISPDFALDTSGLLCGDITSGKAGGCTCNNDHPIRVSPGLLASLYAYEPDAKLSPLNCFVPVHSRHPEAAVIYPDWLCEYRTIHFLQNIACTLALNGQYLDQAELLIKAQATSCQGYADLFEAMYNVGNQDLILGTNVHFDRVLPANAQYNTALVAFHKEMLTRCTMARPEACAALWESLVKEYMDMGGQDVEDEKLAAWDAAHAE